MESVVIHRKKPTSNYKKVANQLLIEGEIPLEIDDNGKILGLRSNTSTEPISTTD